MCSWFKSNNLFFMRLEKVIYASVAQLVEQEIENLRVAGSTPARGTTEE